MNHNFFIVYSELLLLISVGSILYFNTNSKTFSKYYWVIAIAFPICYFYYIIFSYTDNIPFKDDYTLLESIYQMGFSSNFSELSKSLFKQVNQHRFGFERSVMWLIYQVSGNENIKAQIVIGNSFLLGILCLFIKIFRNLKLTCAYFTPIPLILFNLTYFENATWGIAAIQNTPIIFFALLTTHFLSLKNNHSFCWAIFFAVITLFTSGNGIAIWLVGILILTIQNRWKNLIIWGVMMVFLFAFYFLYDYEIISSDKTNLLKHPFLNIQYVLAFWGNAFFQNIPHPNSPHLYWDIFLCIICGIFLSAIILLLFWKMFKNSFQKIPSNTLFLLGGMTFLACTGLMLVLSRPAEVKILNGGELLSRRYMLFGCTFLCMGYLGYLHLTAKRDLLQKLGVIYFLPIGLFLNINSYYTSLADVYKQQQELRLDGNYWKNYQMLLSFGEKYGEKIGYNHPTYMVNLINKLDSSGIYRLSQYESLPLVNLIKNSEDSSALHFDGAIDTTLSIAGTIAQENKVRILFKGLKKSNEQNIEYFALKSQKNVFLLPAIPKNNLVKNCFLSQSLIGLEFIYETWEAKFPSDLYEIWVIERKGNNFKPLFCQRTIQL